MYVGRHAGHTYEYVCCNCFFLDGEYLRLDVALLCRLELPSLYMRSIFRSSYQLEAASETPDR